MSYFKSLVLVSAVLISMVAFSDTKNVERNDAFSVAKERKMRDQGWVSSESSVSMILKNAKEETNVREMRMKTLEVKNGGDKSLTIFDEPRDIQGTAFLVHSHPTEPDDQWLYLPALNRVKRISSRNKSGPFMGSEFSYEDLGSFELAKYTYANLRDDELGGIDVYVLDQIPEDPHSGYTRQTVWLDKEHYRPLKVEYYDRKGSLLKTLRIDDYKRYLDRYWRPHKMTMENHQTKSVTELITHNIRFETGLSEADFSSANLKRVR